LRFVVTGEWDRNGLLRLILFLFLIYTLLFWVTNWLLWFQKMDLTPGSIVHYYLGDPEAEFGQPPRPLGSLAEISHFHLFAMGMLVMTLTHLLLFMPVSPKLKGTLVLVAFLSALVDEGGGWLVRFVHPGLAWLKLTAFLVFQVALLGIVAGLFAGILRPRRNAYGDSAAKQRSPYGGPS